MTETDEALFAADYFRCTNCRELATPTEQRWCEHHGLLNLCPDCADDHYFEQHGGV